MLNPFQKEIKTQRKYISKRSPRYKAREQIQRYLNIECDNALRYKAKTWTLYKSIEFLNTYRTIEERREGFKERIGNIFPLILSLLYSGFSMAEIENALGLGFNWLRQWVGRRPRLMRVCGQAWSVGKPLMRGVKDISLFMDPPVEDAL